MARVASVLMELHLIKYTFFELQLPQEIKVSTSSLFHFIKYTLNSFCTLALFLLKTEGARKVCSRVFCIFLAQQQKEFKLCIPSSPLKHFASGITAIANGISSARKAHCR